MAVAIRPANVYLISSIMERACLVRRRYAVLVLRLDTTPPVLGFQYKLARSSSLEVELPNLVPARAELLAMTSAEPGLHTAKISLQE